MPDLDHRFAALADPTRRAILARLAEGEATVQDLARPFPISQPAISRHLKVLEEAGLIETRIIGTSRPARLKPDAMADLWHWLGQYRALWEAQFLRLDSLLDSLDTTHEGTAAMTEAQLSLVGETEVVIRRRFSHPPAKVWRALTDPALLCQWLSPTPTAAEVDARPGGSFRYDWPKFFFSGPIIEAAPPHRMVHVEHFNGDITEGPTVTTTLTPDGTGTKLTVTMRYRDAAARTKAIKQGFTDGIDQVYGRIEDLAFPL